MKSAHCAERSEHDTHDWESAGATWRCDGNDLADLPTVNSLLSDEIMAARVSVPDMVNHPPHYTSHPSGVECIEITRHMGFNLGNVVKYLWRDGLKDVEVEDQDLRKAAWYLNDEIEKRSRE